MFKEFVFLEKKFKKDRKMSLTTHWAATGKLWVVLFSCNSVSLGISRLCFKGELLKERFWESHYCVLK